VIVAVVAVNEERVGSQAGRIGGRDAATGEGMAVDRNIRPSKRDDPRCVVGDFIATAGSVAPENGIIH